MEKAEIVEMLLKRIDVKGLLIEDVLKVVIKRELEKLVLDSSTPFDDAMFQIVWPALEKALADLVDKGLEKVSAEA